MTLQDILDSLNAIGDGEISPSDVDFCFAEGGTIYDYDIVSQPDGRVTIFIE